MLRHLIKFVGITAFLLLWEIVSRSKLIDAALFPPPTAVISALIDVAASGLLIKDILSSTTRALLGFILGAITGLLIGGISGRIKVVDYVLSPLIQVLRPIPVIAIVPLSIVWFGLGEISKVFLVFWGVFFPVWIAAYLGVSRVDKKYLWAAHSLGVQQQQIWLEVILPAALPTIISGLRTSIGLAFIVLVAAEMAGSFVGVGYRVSAYHLVFEVDKMMGYIVVLGILGFTADRGFTYIINKLLPWYRLSFSQE